MSVGKDPAQSIAVFHWKLRTTIFTAPSGIEPVLDCHMAHENMFISCGVDHIRLWSRVGGCFEVDRGEFWLPTFLFSWGTFDSCPLHVMILVSRRVNPSVCCYNLQLGIFGRKGAVQPMLCCSSLGDECDSIIVSGSTSGHLYVWEGRNCTRCIKAHTDALTTMTVTR